MTREPVTELPTAIVLCPDCGSPYVERISSIIASPNGDFKCNACGWTGRGDLLTVTNASGQTTNPSVIFDSLIRDLKMMLAKDVGKTIGKFLMKWGFISEYDPNLLRRYVIAIATAIVTSVIQEKAQIEKENVKSN